MSSFKIPQASQTVNKSIRFPVDLVDQINILLRNTDCSFSAFVVAATRVAFEELTKKSSPSTSMDSKDD